MELDLAPSEPSVLAYARSHGLCSAYTHEAFPRIPRADPRDHAAQDPSDEDVAAAVRALTQEKLTVTHAAAALLRGVLLGSEQASVCEDAWTRVRALKVELPVLRTDEEVDMLRFGSVGPVLGRLRIPSEKVDGERDEGFAWPSWYAEYTVQWDARVRGEKLGVSREVLRFLQEVVQSPFSDEEFERCKDEAWGVSAMPVSLPRCLTPPLLPLSPPLTPYIPSSPVSRLPLVPESSGSVAAEASVLDEMIMAADTLERAPSDSGDLMLFEITYPSPSSPLAEMRAMPILKRMMEDLKVEGPLTPPILSDSPSKKLKSVSFSQMPHEYIPKAPWAGDYSDGELSSQHSFDELFHDIEPLVKDLEQKVENEQLTIADTTARPKIPDMDFSLPVAPWDEYSRKKNGKYRADETELSAQTAFLRRVKKIDLNVATSWHGLSSIERELPWSIFTATHNPRVSLEETLHGETEFNRIVSGLTTGPIATSETQLWKKEGLRILDMEEDEEELEPAPIQASMQDCEDMEGLVRKRKLEMEEEATQHLAKRTEIQGSLPNSMLANSTSLAPDSRGKPVQTPKQSGTELMFGGFSSTTALQKFMETRGRKVQSTATEQVSVHPEDSEFTGSVQRVPIHAGKVPAAATQPPGTDSQIANTSYPVQILPSVPSNAPPCSFVVSLRLLQQRTLIRKVEQLYPAAELVYRDYNLPHSTAHDADIVLSPSTGLIFTTLQQLKQRALPGQPDRSPVKERVKALHLRYERLIVMASQGLRGEMEEQESNRPEDPRDKEALSLFGGFASKLEGEVLVKYIRGGEKALVHSIVIEMARYGLPHGSEDIGDIKPLAAESNWELFLRRVGFNPFAAQAILASLKEPYDLPLQQASSSLFAHACPQTVSVSGLPAFLTMPAEQRVSRFQVLMGGSRILRKINVALDREWVSAAHGFRM